MFAGNVIAILAAFVCYLAMMIVIGGIYMKKTNNKNRTTF